MQFGTRKFIMWQFDTAVVYHNNFNDFSYFFNTFKHNYCIFFFLKMSNKTLLLYKLLRQSMQSSP